MYLFDLAFIYEQLSYVVFHPDGLAPSDVHVPIFSSCSILLHDVDEDNYDMNTKTRAKIE